MTLHVPIPGQRCVSVDVAITDDIATTDGIDVTDFPYGSIEIPAGSSLTTLTLYGRTETTGWDEDHAQLVQTVAAGQTVALRSAIAGFKHLYIVGNAAGAAIVHLKRSA